MLPSHSLSSLLLLHLWLFSLLFSLGYWRSTALHCFAGRSSRAALNSPCCFPILHLDSFEALQVQLTPSSGSRFCCGEQYSPEISLPQGLQESILGVSLSSSSIYCFCGLTHLFTAKHPQTASLYQTFVVSLAALGLCWPMASFEWLVLDACLPSHCSYSFQIDSLCPLSDPNCKILGQATSFEMDFECPRASDSNCSSQLCHDHYSSEVEAGLRSECYSAWNLAALGWTGGDS